MAQLTRWDPFREMMTLRTAMDRLFNDTFSPTGLFDSTTWSLALDVAEKDNQFVVQAAIPGINPDDLDISLSDNVLTIKGETKAETESDEGQYHLRERRFGSFCRSVQLPTSVEADAVDASYKDGVLTLNIPKAEAVKPRKISVRSPKMIEGELS